MVCYRAGHRSRFFFTPHMRHGRRDEPKAFSWRQHPDLAVMTHPQLGTPVVWCGNHLNVHLVKEPAHFAKNTSTGYRSSRCSPPHRS
nr:hypothetical protein [Streptomyces sp. NRRL S-813]